MLFSCEDFDLNKKYLKSIIDDVSRNGLVAEYLFTNGSIIDSISGSTGITFGPQTTIDKQDRFNKFNNTYYFILMEMVILA